MTVLKGFLIIILSGIAFAVSGALIGYTLGVTMPGYYRAIFTTGREPWFDPESVGLGLGLTQGMICGVIVGAIVVLAVAWHSSRREVVEVDFRKAWIAQGSSADGPGSSAGGRAPGAAGILRAGREGRG